jgi:hypothetical protein
MAVILKAVCEMLYPSSKSTLERWRKFAQSVEETGSVRLRDLLVDNLAHVFIAKVLD